ncbi:MAG TPA: hypothetical protein DHW07_00830 [Gammaproteobacteria bacterium]|nr:hypothetical protein [Gammaproteobacteria bacterium]
MRFFAWLVPLFGLLFIFHNYLIFWQDWPGTLVLIQSWQNAEANALSDALKIQAWSQFASWFVLAIVVAVYAVGRHETPVRNDAERLGEIAAFIIRGCFWGLVLIGILDIVISFLRVEEWLATFVGEDMAKSLGRPIFRGTYVHYPLLAAGLVIALFTRSLGFTWLTLMVVLSEFSIVISRFVYSYEQPFQGDLVRFWYAGLFLFASAYALVTEGHVRVDVLYTNFSKKGKAWANTIGVIVLGLPLCWIILITGMWGKGSSLNSPLLSFEIYQQGFGMYVKYLMVGFLVIFAMSMLFQFCAYLLSNVSTLVGEPSFEDQEDSDEELLGTVEN